jgi:Tfp pilus assembly protein PilN
MPQQINLCTAVLTPQRPRFQARALLTMLAVCLVALGALGAFWLWSLEGSAQTYRQTLEAQAGEIRNLQAAIQASRATVGPAAPELMRSLQDQRAAVLAREKMLQQVRQGLFKPGEGHSDRLLLLARSIPGDAWVTSLKADGGSFEVAGFTLEPASLNEWVARLGQHPLMRGLQLDAVKVNYVAEAADKGLKAKPMWSFSLVSEVPQALPAVARAPVPGVKP